MGLLRPNKSPGRASATRSSGRRLVSTVPGYPAQGHALDANTVALWHLAEHTETQLVADATGTYPLTPTRTSIYVSPLIHGEWKIPGRTGHARLQSSWWSYNLLGPGNLALGTVFNGDWTLEMWVCPALVRMQPTGTGPLFMYRSASFPGPHDTLPLAYFVVGEDGSLGTLAWDVAYQSWPSTSINVPAGLLDNEWAHVALTRHLLGGNIQSFEFFVNGVSVGTGTAPGWSTPISGASHTVGLGCDLVPQDVFTGSLGDTRLSKVVRTSTEITASYQRGLGGP